ncbi:MAG: Transglutaminase-like superfamily [Planctomycetota bacterium]
MPRRTHRLADILRVLARAFALVPLSAATAQNAVPPPSMPVVVRSDPKIVDAQIDLDLYGSPDANPNALRFNQGIVGPVFRIPSATIALSVLTRTSWCDTDFTTLDARCFIDGREIRVDPAQVFVRGQTASDALLVYTLTFPPSGVNTMGVEARYRTQRWEVEVDEVAASRATWPREWSGGPEKFLGKEPGIDPEDPLIRQVATEATPGGPRAASPFVAARNAVSAVLARWKSVTGAASEFGPDRGLRGFRFTTNGASGLAAGGGTPLELALTSVAALRSIGIPARVIYGVEEERGETRASGRSLLVFRYICEFAVAEVGWIPFDPVQMRGSGAGNLPVGRPIRGFANVDRLREVLPLAWRAVPEGYEKADRFATWGWKGVELSGIDATLAVSRMRLVEVRRGNGTPARMPAPVGDGVPSAPPPAPPATPKRRRRAAAPRRSCPPLMKVALHGR